MEEASRSTVIQAGPCVVTQVKSTRTDGYARSRSGFGAKAEEHAHADAGAFPQGKHETPLRTVCEYRFDTEPKYKLGDRIDLSVLEGAEKVDVVGTTKGHGFAGTIKRWGHHRGPAAHGSKNVRESGGIAMCEFPGRVLKGKQMAGHFGNKQETKKNLHVVAIDKERNLLLVRGSIPGHRNGIVFIRRRAGHGVEIMAMAKLFNSTGQAKGTVDLPGDLFDQPVHRQALYEAVKATSPISARALTTPRRATRSRRPARRCSSRRVPAGPRMGTS